MPKYIETVGDLREFLSAFPGEARVRFEDPDTEWLMRFRSELVDSAREWGPENADIVAIKTEDYSAR